MRMRMLMFDLVNFFSFALGSPVPAWICSDHVQEVLEQRDLLNKVLGIT